MESILHITTEKWWLQNRENEFLEPESLKTEGFIHYSQVEFFWRVAPMFKDIEEKLVILIVDPKVLGPNLKYEAFETEGRAYPHLYGPMNTKAIVGILDYHKDTQGNWIKNTEFSHISNI